MTPGGLVTHHNSIQDVFPVPILAGLGPATHRWSACQVEVTGGRLATWPASMPRCYLSGVKQQVRSCHLIGFCDASTGAYAAVLYLLVEADTGRYTRFVASKTRVSPTQVQTIPRLELLATLLLARLTVTVSESLGLQIHLGPPTCYTDSEVARFWIVGLDKKWKTFYRTV